MLEFRFSHFRIDFFGKINDFYWCFLFDFSLLLLLIGFQLKMRINKTIQKENSCIKIVITCSGDSLWHYSMKTKSLTLRFNIAVP